MEMIVKVTGLYTVHYRCRTLDFEGCTRKSIERFGFVVEDSAVLATEDVVGHMAMAVLGRCHNVSKERLGLAFETSCIIGSV